MSAASDISPARGRLPTVPAMLAAASATAVTAVLCVVDLGSKPLAQDEASSWFIAQLDPSGLWQAISQSEANASLYYSLLHLWIKVGDSEFTMRALSVIFAVATIPVVFVLGRRLLGAVAGLLASLMLGVNAFFIAHAQEVRGYSLSALLAAAATYLFVHLVEQPSRRGWIAYAVVSAAACYAHMFAGLVVLAHIVSLAFLKWEELPRGKLGAAYGAVAALVAPLAYFVTTHDVGQTDWVPEPSVKRLLIGLEDFAGGGGRALLYFYGAVLLLAIAGAVFRPRDHKDRWRRLLLVLWAVLPVAASFGFSYVKPLFVSRYLLVASPGLALAAAAGLWTFRHSVVRAIAIAVVGLPLVLSFRGLQDWYDHEPFSWAQLVDGVVASSQPHDGMVFYAPTMVRQFDYYAHRLELTERLPDEIYPSLDWIGFSQTDYDPDYAALGRAADGHRRVWLIKGKDDDRPRRVEARKVAAALAESCPVPGGGFFRGQVVLFAACGRV